MKNRKLTPEMVARVEAEIILMVLAERDYYKNRVEDGSLAKMPERFSHDTGGYYGEAFGVMRGLVCLGYGTLNGPSNIAKTDPLNLNFWFYELVDKALATEREFGLGIAFQQARALVSEQERGKRKKKPKFENPLA
jgi:hypothetical protein